jgi:hypothetical protein
MESDLLPMHAINWLIKCAGGTNLLHCGIHPPKKSALKRGLLGLNWTQIKRPRSYELQLLSAVPAAAAGVVSDCRIAVGSQMM